MPNNFQLVGAQSNKQTRYAPLYQGSFFSGLYTNRSPLTSNQSNIYAKYYPTYDALIAGSNIEISNRRTVIRRPGNLVYNSESFTDVLSFYSFHEFSTTSEQIRVMVDTAAALYDGTGPSTKTLVLTKSAGAGQTYMQGVGNNLFFGDGVDQGKWVQTLYARTSSAAELPNIGDSVSLNSGTTPLISTYVIDSNGDIEQLLATSVGSITNVTYVESTNTLTLAFSGGFMMTAGVNYIIWNAATATWLNGVTFTAVTGTTATLLNELPTSYSSAPDTGNITLAVGGTPTTGGSVPSWNATLLGITIDGTAVWINRGSPTENWGIVAPTAAPNFVVGASNVSWQANTFYSNAQVIVDTQYSAQTNIWSVTDKGVSGASNPFTSNPTAGVTTVTDGTVTWTCVASTNSGDSAWAASTAFASDSLIVANASGTNCLFQVQPNAFPVYKQVAGTYVTANFYPHNEGTYAGQCELRNPVDGTNNPGSGSYTLSATATGNSVLFNPNQISSNTSPLEWATLTEAGNISGYTTPYSGATPGNYTMIVFGTVTIPTAGQYSFTIFHDDGMFWGVGASAGNQATVISGPKNSPAPTPTLTALQGYAVMGANNSSGVYQDTFVINFPVAGDYPYEIDFAKSGAAGQFCCMYCNGQTPIPGTAETGTVEPIWPAWVTTFAPAYPSVSEMNNAGMGSLSGESWNNAGNGKGPLTWNNLGPITDYSWKADIQYLTTAGSTIIDSNNNTEDPYEAGVTGTTAPTFATGLNQLTKDNPNLIWINQGPAAAPPPGTLSTFDGGWIYWIALVNTLTNTVSNLSPASAATGNFVGSSGVRVSGGLPASIDPQIDYVAIFRSEDGGDTPFLIPGTGNSLYTVPLATYEADGYVDTTPDSGLNILLEGANEGQNTPPASGAVNLAYHLGRIFYSIGNVVYWTSGPDTPIGNGIEGVGVTNNATFPSLVKRLVPTSVGLFVYTVSDIYLISGNGTSQSPLFPVPYLPGKGISSYNAVAINGTLTYIFTTASAVMAVDPNGGYYDLGFAIGDQFKTSNWVPANAYLTWFEFGEDVALYVGDGSTGWFRGNPTPSPESGQTWSPFGTIVGGVKAIASTEVTPGVQKLLVGSSGTGPILARDLTTNADNGTPYAASFTIGSLVLAQPGQMAQVGFIAADSIAVGTRPSVSVLLDEISGTFEALNEYEDDPPRLPPSETTYAQRWYLLEGEEPALCRHMQIQFSYPAENEPNELLTVTVFGGFLQTK